MQGERRVLDFFKKWPQVHTGAIIYYKYVYITCRKIFEVEQLHYDSAFLWNPRSYGVVPKTWNFLCSKFRVCLLSGYDWNFSSKIIFCFYRSQRLFWYVFYQFLLIFEISTVHQSFAIIQTFPSWKLDFTHNPVGCILFFLFAKFSQKINCPFTSFFGYARYVVLRPFWSNKSINSSPFF